MKRQAPSFWIALFLVVSICCLNVYAQEDSRRIAERIMQRPGKSMPEKPIVMGYVTSWSTGLPDPSLLTHIAYAFATVDSNFTTVTIKRPDRFKEIMNLKKTNPELKILLSVGGAGAGNFSEMADDKKLRRQFCKNLADTVKAYGLDGIDLDWEVPGQNWGISSSPRDKHNFTLLMQDLRKSLGKKKILTFAVPHHGDFYEFKKVMKVVDFVGIMCYDMGLPERFHNALHNSTPHGQRSYDDVLAHFYSLGVDPAKMVIGVPFYGRGDKKNYPDFTDYCILSLKPGIEERYDSVAEVPYLVDTKTGEVVLTYENPCSLEAKCKWVKELGAAGMLFWHYTGDSADHQLLNTINRVYRNK